MTDRKNPDSESEIGASVLALVLGGGIAGFLCRDQSALGQAMAIVAGGLMAEFLTATGPGLAMRLACGARTLFGLFYIMTMMLGLGLNNWLQGMSFRVFALKPIAPSDPAPRVTPADERKIAETVARMVDRAKPPAERDGKLLPPRMRRITFALSFVGAGLAGYRAATLGAGWEWVVITASGGWVVGFMLPLVFHTGVNFLANIAELAQGLISLAFHVISHALFGGRRTWLHGLADFIAKGSDRLFIGPLHRADLWLWASHRDIVRNRTPEVHDE